MALDRIQLITFRNHAHSAIDGTSRFNLLVGENGAGKTNVLEALSLLAPGRGLRRAPLSEMAQANGPGGFAINVQLTGDDHSEPVSLGTGTEAAQPNRRQIRINGSRSSAVTLGEWLSVCWLTPAQDRLFTDSAGARRRQMDRMALALFPTHSSHAARYEAALRERNRLLSGDGQPDPEWLASLEAQMAASGSMLAQGRAELVTRLEDTLAEEAPYPFARPHLRYRSSAPMVEELLAEALTKSRPKDRAAGRSLVGPHRDELEATMEGTGAPAAQCSTGEQKAMLVAMTLAHAGLAASGRPSVLLLDEIAAHLDPIRRDALYDRLRHSGAQIWMTGTEPAPFSGIEREAAVWQVTAGTVERP
jgi:DNA replication and repair protein RecF